MLLLFSPLIFRILLANFRTCHPSLPETDPQILEHWGYADEDHLAKSFPSDGFWSRMLAWHTTAFVNWTHWIGFRMFELFRKIDEDFGGSISWNTQPNCRVLFSIATALLSPLCLDLLLGCSSTWRCASEHFSPICIHFLSCRTSTPEDAQLFHRMSGASSFEVNPCTAVEPFSHFGFCLSDFWFSMHFSDSAA